MVVSQEQLIALAKRVASFELVFDMSSELDDLTEEERRAVAAFAVYIIRFVGRGPSQRRALALFRSWLTDDMREELRRAAAVIVIGSAGGTYRISPFSGQTQRVERHGRRWFAKASYCYHDEEGDLPKADVALAHLLFLATDEPRFLASANASELGDQLWNREYLRRIREARARREAEAA